MSRHVLGGLELVTYQLEITVVEGGSCRDVIGKLESRHLDKHDTGLTTM